MKRREALAVPAVGLFPIVGSSRSVDYAYLQTGFACRECGHVMAYFSDHSGPITLQTQHGPHQRYYAMACHTPECIQYGVKYKIPTVDLERV